MPFAQWHYPFENKEMFEANFPADFISEAIDQTRGWFYTLLAIGTLIFDRSPFENCLVLGHVQDKDGIKMSKHKGNVVDPWEVLDKQGADAVRWYFYAAGAPWLPSRFSGDMVSEVQRKFMGTLWNTYAFFTLYASIDGYDPNAQKAKPEDFSLMDKWVLSRLNTLVDFVDRGLADYKVTETSRAIAAFVDALSNWYVRRCRERFWGKGLEGDKLAAFETLYTVLVTLSGLTAPFTPFMAESIYQNLVAKLPGAKPSVHLTDFPAADLTKVDRQLEDEMEKVIEVVQLGRACRATANMKTRQTAATLYVKGAALTPGMADLVADELNVREVAFVDDARAFTTYKIKPQLRTVGPKYGKLVGAIGKALLEMDGNDVVDAFAAGKTIRLEVDGTPVELSETDVLTEPMQKTGFVAEMDGGVTAVLDTNLTEELIEEGFVREVISKIQTQRREAEFEVTDHIHVTLKTTDRLAGVVSRGSAEILRAALADSLIIAEPEGVVRDWSINGEAASLGIRKA